jgi:phosphate-selective porin OprO and OprP
MKKVILILMIITAPLMSFGQGCEAPSEEGVNLFGFLQPQYDAIFDGGETNQFNFNRARLGVMGEIPYDFQYYAVLEMSPLFVDGGSPFLLDAFVSYTRFNWLKMSMGQFKVPMSLELSQGCHKLYTINRSKTVTELVGPLRDMGFMLSGGNDTTFIQYQAGLFNGPGINNMDVNIGKDFVGRVILNPFQNNLLKIGGSYKMGSRPNADATVTEEDTYMRYGFEAQANIGNLHIQGEYIYAKDVGSTFVGGGCGGPGELVQGDFEKRGFYGMAVYAFESGFQPVAKFEMYDKDLTVDNMAEYITTVGFNYFFNDWTRLQINYCMIQESAVQQIDNDRLMVQMQIKF